jgi:hypothetical protein
MNERRPQHPWVATGLVLFRRWASHPHSTRGVRNACHLKHEWIVWNWNSEDISRIPDECPLTQWRMQREVRGFQIPLGSSLKNWLILKFGAPTIARRIKQRGGRLSRRGQHFPLYSKCCTYDWVDAEPPLSYRNIAQSLSNRVQLPAV